MTTYLHLPIMAISFFILLATWRFWSCINRMGFTKEVGRRAPWILQGDVIASILALMPFLLALVDWVDLALPHQSSPTASYMAVFVSVGCLLGWMFIVRQSGERFAGHWAGTRESALRTVAALRIIDAAELAYALEVARQHEARHGSGRVLKVESREERK
ncbi:MAG: hypothetical protein ACTH7Y_00410 [Halomonas sp.]